MAETQRRNLVHVMYFEKQNRVALARGGVGEKCERHPRPFVTSNRAQRKED